MRPRTILALARLADACFAYNTYNYGSLTAASSNFQIVHHERVDWFSDFLFEKGYPAAVLRVARGLAGQSDAIKDFVIHLWEDYSTFFRVTDDTKLAELRTATFGRLAADLLEYAERPASETLAEVSSTTRKAVVNELRLDGYTWDGQKLIHHEENTFDVCEQEGTLVSCYRTCELDGLAQLEKELKDIDDHYVSGKFGDCIKHARDLMEVVLHNVATSWAAQKLEPLPDGSRERPVVVRDYLARTSFITQKEKELLNALWKLLSDEGGHPNIAAVESARICRQYALSAAHFLLLRCQARGLGATTA